MKKGNYLEKCIFSGQQSCFITIAAANIICSCLKGKKIDFVWDVLNNCQAMMERNGYGCPNFQVFSDISQFPHRVACIKLVVRGLIKLINTKL